MGTKEMENADDVSVEIGDYLDNSRTGLIRCYDDATNRAKYEKNPSAAMKSLVMARDIIEDAITSLEKIESETAK